MVESEVIKLYKNLGETPLECIERFRLAKPEFALTNMTYLGRLDPMAEGLLLVLAGNTRDKKPYLDLDKAYEFEVLWGFETDTYDLLGLVTGTGKMPEKLDMKMEKLLENVSKKKTQEYPPYSSRTVGGKALHTWAREGKIEEIDIPSRQIRIFSLEHTNTRLLKKEELLKEIEERISLVKGDFRQAEILKTWKRAIELQAEMNYNHEYLVSGFKADVSSGTYIRSLAKEMGEMLTTSACAQAYVPEAAGPRRALSWQSPIPLDTVDSDLVLETVAASSWNLYESHLYWASVGCQSLSNSKRITAKIAMHNASIEAERALEGLLLILAKDSSQLVQVAANRYQLLDEASLENYTKMNLQLPPILFSQPKQDLNFPTMYCVAAKVRKTYLSLDDVRRYGVLTKGP